MRTIDADALAQIIAARAEVIHLIELDFSGGTLYLSTAGFDVSWNSHTWEGIGGVLSWGPVSETADDKAQGIPLQLSGVDQTVISLLLSQKIRGRGCKVYRAWVARGTNLLKWSRSLSSHSGIWVPAEGGGATDPTVTAPTTDVKDPDGGSSASKIAFPAVPPGNSSQLLQSTGLTGISGDYLASVKLRTLTGQATLHIGPLSVGVGVVGGQAITVTDSWTRFSGLGTLASATLGWILYSNTGDNGGAAVTVYAYDAQLHPGSVLQDPTGTTTAPVTGGQLVGAPLLLFNGFLNEAFSITESHDAEGNAKGVEISTRAASRTAELAQHRGIMTNVMSHQRYFSGDNFFRLTASLMGQKIYWPGPNYTP